VVDQFLAACNEHGMPASALTDNGRTYTARFGGGRNAFEYLLAILGITQQNGSANHPQTQGKVDKGGKVSLRRAGRMHHLGVGYADRGTKILAIADDTTVTVINLTTGEILSTHDIDPDRPYWRNTQRSPGRWPGLP